MNEENLDEHNRRRHFYNMRANLPDIFKSYYQ